MISKLLFLVTLSIMLSALPAAAQWDFQQITGWTGSTTSDIAYKSNGYPVIAQSRRISSTTNLDVIIWDGQSWITTNIASTSSQYCTPVRVLITTNDVVLIAYGYSGGSFYLYRMDLGPIASFSGTLYDVAMTAGTARTEYTLHFLYSNGGYLCYRSYPTPNTEVHFEINVSGGKIALDSQNQIHTVFTATTGPTFLKYGFYDGALWSSWPLQPQVQSGNYRLTMQNGTTPTLFAQTGSSPNYTVQQIVIQR